jgi:CheY-like chemotaxis protein
MWLKIKNPNYSQAKGRKEMFDGWRGVLAKVREDQVTKETRMTLEDENEVTVLVVDDSPQSLVALEALLSDLDRKIVKASSGEEALKYLLQEDVGVILLDVQMAGLDGYQTAVLIRERGRTRNVPIIFLTAHNKDETDVAKGYAIGAADYLFKPVVTEALKSKVTCLWNWRNSAKP